MARQLTWAMALAGVLAFGTTASNASENYDFDASALASVQDHLSDSLKEDASEFILMGRDARRALSESLTPRPRSLAAQPISYTRDWIADQPLATGADDWACLSQALYFEARGESVKGQFAVGEVILNRADSDRFPGTVCAVIDQGTGKKYQCQFSFKCDGLKEVIHEKQAFEDVSKVARAILDAHSRPLTDGATFYHTKAVNPNWARKFTRTTTIGVHHFYRYPTQVSER